MRWLYASLLALAMVGGSTSADPPASAAPPTLKVAPALTVEVGKKCVIAAETTAKKVTWSIPPGVDAMPLDGKRLAVWAPPGTYTLRAAVPNGDDVVMAVVTLTVTGPRPPPGPVDPVVPPVVEQSPWDNAPGLRVLVVYPARGALPAAQQSIVAGKRVRDYLDAKCAKENGEAAYFIWKTGEDVTATPATWQRAYATVKGDKWVVIGNGAKWTAAPMPDGPDAMLELLRRFE